MCSYRNFFIRFPVIVFSFCFISCSDVLFPEFKVENVSYDDNKVTVKFSAEVDGDSAKKAISLQEDDTEITGTFFCSGNKISFFPKDGIRKNYDYDLAITTLCEDSKGISLEKDFHYSFSTRDEHTRPEIISISPANQQYIEDELEYISIVFDGNNSLITTTFLATGNLGTHYGIDMSIRDSKDIYALFFNDSSKAYVFDNCENTPGGNYVELKTGFNYMYKGQNFTDIIQQRYMHLDEIKVENKANVYSATLLGIGGNTGTKTTAAHLHLDVSTKNQSPWLSYLSNQNNMSFSSGYKERYWYNPEIFLKNNYSWKYKNANTYNK